MFSSNYRCKNKRQDRCPLEGLGLLRSDLQKVWLSLGHTILTARLYISKGRPAFIVGRVITHTLWYWALH